MSRKCGSTSWLKVKQLNVHTLTYVRTPSEEKGRLMEVWESGADGMRREKTWGGEKNEPKIMGHCASTVHTIKHRPGAESLSNYSPINASGMITVTAKDKCA